MKSKKKHIGRNFDFEDKKSMVVITEPKDGYKSISTCNLELLGSKAFGAV